MKLLWLTWKDGRHPLAGGAETVNEELARRLVAEGHEVTFLVGGWRGAPSEEVVNGYRIIRLGNRWNVYWKTYRYYKRHLVGWADLVIDEVNTMPFFAKLYVKERNIIFAHMLCRQIWFYQMPFPLSLIGYAAEPFYLRLLADREVITVSESSKRDLAKVKFLPERIHMISEGISHPPLAALPGAQHKFAEPTVLSFGSIRAMKRTHHQIKAFEIAKRDVPQLKLVVAGDSSGRYGRKVLQAIERSRYASDIRYVGRVSMEEKLELMRKCHAIMVTSVKEGWGLIVTEAASQGTPAVVYNADGLRDSVLHQKTGLVTLANTPAALASTIVRMVCNQYEYQNLAKAAWEHSKQINFERSYQHFKKAIRI